MRDEVVREIRDELNVKQFEVVSSLEGLLSYRVVPNFKVLGPRLGKLLPRVKKLLESVDGADVRRAFDEGRNYVVECDGTTVELGADDVEIRAERHEDLTLVQDGPHAVALDLTLDDALRAEGLARELVRSINDQRKADGFNIADRIRVVVRGSEKYVGAVRAHADWIAGEVLAVDLRLEVDAGAAVEDQPRAIELNAA